jgi:hypothetical protein
MLPHPAQFGGKNTLVIVPPVHLARALKKYNGSKLLNKNSSAYVLAPLHLSEELSALLSTFVEVKQFVQHTKLHDTSTALLQQDHALWYDAPVCIVSTAKTLASTALHQLRKVN